MVFGDNGDPVYSGEIASLFYDFAKKKKLDLMAGSLSESTIKEFFDFCYDIREGEQYPHVLEIFYDKTNSFDDVGFTSPTVACLEVINRDVFEEEKFFEI